jgi:hypothetical protein
MKAVLKMGSRALAVVFATAAISGTASACHHRPPCHCSTDPAVPEIDPGSAAGAMTLLVGSVLTLGDRRRPR